jgi:DNA-binding response OmpR family regulator
VARQSILIVEDEMSLLSFYQETLEQAGYKTRGARTGQDALDAVDEFQPNLVILDLGLFGDLDGFDVLSELRRKSNVSVMILTAHGGDERLVRGLNLGADNYVLKPVSREHLLARVRAQLRLRRNPNGNLAGRYRYGDLIVDIGRSQIVRRGKRRVLGDAERRVMARLLQTPGETVSQRELMEIGWGFSGHYQIGWEDMQPLSNCIYRLRNKLKPSDGRRLIETVIDVGFYIVPPDERLED